MVRLEDPYESGNGILLHYFNSTMVRLEEECGSKVKRDVLKISIPLWYD